MNYPLDIANDIAKLKEQKELLLKELEKVIIEIAKLEEKEN